MEVQTVVISEAAICTTAQPHMPWDAPQEFFDLYPEEEMDLPLNK